MISNITATLTTALYCRQPQPLISLEYPLSNAIRHAEASQINIVPHASDKLSLQVIDNGKGIDDKGLRGHGLSFMKHRIEKINGYFEIKNLTQGTNVQLTI